VLELSGTVPKGEGYARAEEFLDDGRAWTKFQAICEAQGGIKEIPMAPLTHDILAPIGGRVVWIDNRRLARIAKLAGAPNEPSAGVEMHVRLGDHVDGGATMFTVHAESEGELEYALEYARRHIEIIRIDDSL
jgi:thymidine phosphorylase